LKKLPNLEWNAALVAKELVIKTITGIVVAVNRKKVKLTAADLINLNAMTLQARTEMMTPKDGELHHNSVKPKTGSRKQENLGKTLLNLKNGTSIVPAI
jgi:hypothetical protein